MPAGLPPLPPPPLPPARADIQGQVLEKTGTVAPLDPVTHKVAVTCVCMATTPSPHTFSVF